MAIGAGCVVLTAAACDGGNAFGSDVGFGGDGDGTGVGSIQGQVLADGASQGGVTVTLSNNQTAVTNTSGQFTFTQVASGTYQVSVQVPLGYQLAAGQTSSRTVTVDDGEDAEVTFLLNRSPGTAPAP